MNTVYTIICVFLLSLAVSAQNVPSAKEVHSNTDDELVNLLISRNADEANAVTKEIFARGQRMIPLLLKQEGNQKCFYGLMALGNWDRPGLVRSGPCIPRSPYFVTVQIAALYLISAIFHDDLEFADPPVLCEFSIEQKKCIEAENSSLHVETAWDATRKWSALLSEKGMDHLRKQDQDPLKGSGLRFY